MIGWIQLYIDMSSSSQWYDPTEWIDPAAASSTASAGDIPVAEEWIIDDVFRFSELEHEVSWDVNGEWIDDVVADDA